MIALFNFSSSWLKRLALVVVVLTTATGCLRMDMAIRVEPDGTGTVEIEMLLSETLTELAEAFSDEDAGDLCAEMFNESAMSDMPAGAEARELSKDGWCGAEISFSFTDFDLTELSTADGMPIRLWVENQTVFFDLDVSDLTADFDEDMSFEEMAAMAKVFDLALDEPKMVFEVTLPGAPVDHNADSTQGSTFNWELDLFGDESRTSFYASADMSRSDNSDNASSSGLFLVGGLVGGLGLAAIFAFAVRIRSARKSDGDQEIDQKGPIG
ncbi:MAG TPA: hypothetical protein QF651_09065 [Acidimicrobiales bacterium]|nr:hypothetical protein [Acidimicrobiales bacterium]